MPYSDLVTQKKPRDPESQCFSQSRAIKDGRLEYADPDRLLHRPGLEMRFARKTRPRIDKPQCKAQIGTCSRRSGGSSRPGNPGREIATDYWSRLDQKLQWVLEGGPGWQREKAQLMLFGRT